MAWVEFSSCNYRKSILFWIVCINDFLGYFWGDCLRILSRLDVSVVNLLLTDGLSVSQVLIIGGGPCGLRTAIEAQLLGAKVVVIEKRDRFSRNNVLHLWPFVINDLRALGAKKFFGKFCAGSIDHISTFLSSFQLSFGNKEIVWNVVFNRCAEYQLLNQSSIKSLCQCHLLSILISHGFVHLSLYRMICRRSIKFKRSPSNCSVWCYTLETISPDLFWRCLFCLSYFVWAFMVNWNGRFHRGLLLCRYSPVAMRSAEGCPAPGSRSARKCHLRKPYSSARRPVHQ